MNRLFYSLSLLLLAILLLNPLAIYAYDQSTTLKVGETKTISLPSEVTSKNIYSYNCSVDSPSYVEIVSYTKTSVTVRGIKEYKYTVHVRFDFFYTEGSYNRSDTHMINIDVYEEGSGGGSTGVGDDTWGNNYIPYGSWGTITVERGKEKVVYAQYSIPNEDKVKCYKWSGKNALNFEITNKDWNSCTIKGNFEGSSSKLYCYMEYGTTAYQAYYDVVVTEPKKILVTSISLNSNSVNLSSGETKQLSASVSPSNASDKTVTWASDNVDVATVSSTGLVKGIGDGSATITCRATDGSGVSATCKVEVNKLSVSANPPEGLISKGRVVKLSSNVLEATIYYTLDNSTPTEKSKQYSPSGIPITKSCTLKAIAKCPGYITSDVFSAKYDVIEEDENTPFEICSETWEDEGFYDITWYNNSQDVFYISTPQELAGLAYLFNKGKCSGRINIKLTNDIDLSGRMWVGIGSSGWYFMGSFDGQNHTISGINISANNDNKYAGFFGNVRIADICNLNLTGRLCADQVCSYIGGLAGWLESCKVSNVYCNIPIYIKNNLNKYGDGMWITDDIGGICGCATKSVFSNTIYRGDIIIEQYPQNVDYKCMHFDISGFSPCLINGTSAENCEARCNKIVVDFPAQIDPKKQSTTPSLNVGCFSFNDNGDALLKYCSSICNDIIINSFSDCKIQAKMIGGIISYGSKASSINCISILKRFTSTTDVKYYIDFDANNCSSATDCFTNSDVDFIFKNAVIEKSFDNVTTYTSSYMQTENFFYELNQYSIKNEGEPVWVQGEDKYPICKDCYYLASGINDIIADEDKQGQIYSISGMRLKSPQKGINIINGKKILVK